MKPLLKTCIPLFFICLLTSCASYQEELWLNADGSGKYELTADNSASLGLMEAFSQMGDETDASEEQAKPDFWTDLGGEEIDRVINLRDSVSQEFLSQLERPELLDKMIFRLIGSKQKELLKTILTINFTNLDELQEILTLAGEINQHVKDKEDGVDFIEGIEFFATRPGGHGFKMEKGRLTRQATIEDETMLNSLTEGGDSMETLEMMMEQSIMTCIIHLPGEVYQVNNKSELGTVEGKTVTFSYQMLDLIKKEVDTTFEILFK